MKSESSQCKDALKDHINGLDQGPQIPMKRCRWMDTKTNEKISYKITSHKAYYDIYDESYVNPLFLGGRCQQSPCSTSTDSTIWLPKREYVPACQITPATAYYVSERFEVETVDGVGNIDRKKKVQCNKNSLIIIEGHDPLPIQSICKMKVCGKEGYRFQTGIWASITALDQEHIFKSVPECLNNATIVAPRSLSSSALETKYEIDISQTLSCLNAVKIAKATGKISVDT